MPIYKGTLKTGAAYKGSTSLSRIYKGAYLVFEAFKTLIAEGVPPLTLLNCAAEIMLGYKIYGDSKLQSLPDGYTQLEYIESTGTQYIDTGIKPTNSSFELTISNPTSTVTSGTYVCGVYSTPRIMLYFTTSTTRNIRVNVNGNSSETTTLVDDVAVAKYDNSTGIFSYNDFDSTSIGTQTFTSNDNFYLFAANNGGTPYNLGRIQTLRIHNAKLWNDNVLVMNMIPAKNSSNVIGMYDTVSHTFYPNAGTGTFVAGPVSLTPGTPTPEIPVEIKSVGDKTYNLWNPSGTNYGWINTDGALKINEGVGRRIIVEVGKTYNYVSSKEANGEFFNCIAQYDENMNFISGTRANINNSQKTKTNSVTITNSSTKYLVCSYYTTSPYTAPDTNMITEGTTVPEYKPYGYEIPITVSGVNVFNKDAAEKSGCTLSGYKFTATGLNANIDIKIPAGTYTLSCSNNQTIYLRNGKVSSGTIASKTSSDASVTFNFTGSVDGYLRISFFGGDVSNIQIQSGSSPTAFEDYFAPATYSTYLTYPLYKLGNSVDYIDFEQQKIIRNNRPVTFTGSESFSSTSLTVPDYFTCIQSRSDRASTYQSTLSTHFKYISSSITDNGLFFGGSNNNFIYFRINQSYGVTSTDTFKAWLAGQYNDGTPVVFVYPLANPLENSISAPNILLHKGTNIISVGTIMAPTNVWVKYKSKSA